MKTTLAVCVLAGLAASAAQAQQLDLDFQLSTTALSPGTSFWVRLAVQNSGPALASADLFAALDIGTGDYWFWPSWTHYPPGIDSRTVTVPAGASTHEILPAFAWPSGAGSGSAQFIAAALDGGVLASDIPVAGFAWSDLPPGTPTPAATPEAGFATVPAGSFTMGSPPGEMCRGAYETEHTVILSRGLLAQTREVTQAEWVGEFGANPSLFAGCDACPVENVTWFDAAIYCNRRSQAAGLRPAYYADPGFSTVFNGTPPVTSGAVYWDQSAAGYRLPTESEWEYACRAGTSSAYSSGLPNLACSGADAHLDPLAWYSANSSSQSHPAAGKQANNWGLFDCHGNTYEWCWDWLGVYPPGPAMDPTGPATGTLRVIRGGGWNGSPDLCRSAARNDVPPSHRDGSIGLRPVRTVF